MRVFNRITVHTYVSSLFNSTFCHRLCAAVSCMFGCFLFWLRMHLVRRSGREPAFTSPVVLACLSPSDAFAVSHAHVRSPSLSFRRWVCVWVRTTYTYVLSRWEKERESERENFHNNRNNWTFITYEWGRRRERNCYQTLAHVQASPRCDAEIVGSVARSPSLFSLCAPQPVAGGDCGAAIVNTHAAAARRLDVDASARYTRGAILI